MQPVKTAKEKTTISQVVSFQDYCQIISKATGYSIDFILFVYECLKKPIRDQQDLDVFTKLTNEIPVIVNDNGANQFTHNKEEADVHVRVLQDCIKLVTKKFSYLAIEEVKEAYSLWSAGKIKGLEMFRGEFNQKQFGSVLASYAAYRSPIVIKLNEYVDAMRQVERESKKAEKFEQEFPLIVTEAIKKIERWQDVPDFWCHAFRRRGWISITAKEGQKMLQIATKEAKLEQKRRQISEGVTNIQRALNGTSPQTEEQIAKSIARKMIVFEKCVENKNWKPQRQVS